MQPTDSQSARDELFRRIGRNVVYFQYLEARLRIMLPVLFTKGTLKELQARQDKVSRKLKKTPLGNLVKAYHERVFSKISDEAVPDEVLSEPTLAFGFCIEVTPETEAQRKRHFNKLLRERNRLIHKDFLSVDLDSREECEQLFAQLDEQYAEILRWLDHLNSLQTAIQETAPDLRRFLESDEFSALFRVEGNDT